jgi:hypothetical protein
MNVLVKYTVFIGGTEVNDYFLEHEEAMKLADSYEKKGYTDVIVECIEYNENEYRTR